MSTCARGRVLDRTSIAALVQECPQVDATALTEMAVPSYLHWNPFVRWIIRKRLLCLANIVIHDHTKRILDFGCGLGLLGETLRDNIEHIYLHDIELRPAAVMVDRHGLENTTLLSPGEIESCIGDGELDIVVAADVLEHLDTAESVDSQCAEFARKLAPGGRLLLSGPTETALYRMARWVAGFSGEYHHRNVFDLELVLEESGWERRHVVELPRWLPIVLFRISVWQRTE